MVAMAQYIKVITCCILMTGCGRPSADYDVSVVGDGTSLDDIVGGVTPMGGVVEYTRMRFAGENLGHGLTGLFSDATHVDGSSLVFGSAQFGYPPNPTFDRTSSLLTPAAPGENGTARCITIPGARTAPGPVEYVDVGDKITLTGEQFHTTLDRDPAFYPRPAGESWYVGYGNRLMPVLTNHPVLPNNWKSEEAITLNYPGALPPDSATIGAIPYPGQASMRLPPALEGLEINSTPVVDTTAHRFQGPWTSPVELVWTPHADPSPLNLSLRLIAKGVEGPCDCAEDCGDGFACEEGQCAGVDGASWNQLGEVVCHVPDTGSFSLTAAHLNPLLQWTGPPDGAILSIARMREAQFNITPVLTFNQRRVDISPIRVRTTDVIYTRLEVPE